MCKFFLLIVFIFIFLVRWSMHHIRNQPRCRFVGEWVNKKCGGRRKVGRLVFEVVRGRRK